MRTAAQRAGYFGVALTSPHKLEDLPFRRGHPMKAQRCGVCPVGDTARNPATRPRLDLVSGALHPAPVVGHFVERKSAKRGAPRVVKTFEDRPRFGERSLGLADVAKAQPRHTVRIGFEPFNAWVRPIGKNRYDRCRQCAEPCQILFGDGWIVVRKEFGEYEQRGAFFAGDVIPGEPLGDLVSFLKLFGRKGHFTGVLCEQRSVEKAENAPVLGGRESSGLPKPREGREFVSVQLVDCPEESSHLKTLEP